MSRRSVHDKRVGEMRSAYVYIMTNAGRTLYIGVTTNLEGRVFEHQNECFPGFTQRHPLHQLVYVEDYSDIRDAIAHERQLKGWRRSKKLELISTQNPEWRDLSAEWRLTPIDELRNT